jgi:hypothetical protein
VTAYPETIWNEHSVIYTIHNITTSSEIYVEYVNSQINRFHNTLNEIKAITQHESDYGRRNYLTTIGLSKLTSFLRYVTQIINNSFDFSNDSDQNNNYY